MEKLNDRMQPGRMSQVGFLAVGEKLVQVCQKDAETLKKLGITFEQIADRLEVVIMKARFLRQGYGTPLIDDKIAVPPYLSTGGYQECPFSKNDDHICGKGSSMISIYNLNLKKGIHNITELHAHLIRDHHFFEGSTGYRLDPELAIEVLDIKPKVDYKVKTISEAVWRNSGSESSISNKDLEAAKEHQLALVSEAREFEAYLLPYYNWDSYKYRGLTNRQKIEKVGLEKNKNSGQIDKDIQDFLEREKMYTKSDGTSIDSRLDKQVWELDGEQYLHVFKFQTLSDMEKNYRIGGAELRSKEINKNSKYTVYSIHTKISPILDQGDRVSEKNPLSS